MYQPTRFSVHGINDINTVPDIESELRYGKGRAYGLEYFRLTQSNGPARDQTRRNILFRYR